MERLRLKPGDRVVCLGDSITVDPHGYVTLAQQVLARSIPGVEVVNAGRPGHTAADLVARLERDALAQRPSWVTLCVGGNDARHGVPVAAYQAQVQAMVDGARTAGAAVALCTPPPFEPHEPGLPAEPANALIERYAGCLEALADEQDLLLIPVHAVFRLVHEAGDPADPVRLTHDGVHMSPTGRYLMGLTFLAAFGVSVEPNPN